MKLPVLVRDWLSLTPPDYFLFLSQDSVSLIRLARGNRLEVLHGKELSGPVVADKIADFCRDLRQSGFYYGQPLSVIVSRPELFTYAKRMNRAKSAEIFERVRLLSQEGFDLQTHLFQARLDRIFVAQAFDKNLIASLRKALHDTGIYAEQIVGLSTVMIRAAMGRGVSENSIEIHLWPRILTTYLIQDDRGNIVFNTLDSEPSPGELDATASSLREVFFEPEARVETKIYSPVDDKVAGSRQLPLVSILKRGIQSARKIGSLALRTELSRPAVALRIAINSARLLVLVLGAAFVISALTAGITGIAALSDDDLIEDYQEHYQAKLELERTRDSLLMIEQQVFSERRPTRDLAPIVSAFCQRRFNSLALTRVYIGNVSAESTFVEIGGSAENEDVIFRYVEAVSPFVAPYSLNMSSMQPEIRSLRGAADTTITFKLRMIAD